MRRQPHSEDEARQDAAGQRIEPQRAGDVGGGRRRRAVAEPGILDRAALVVAVGSPGTELEFAL